MTLLLKAFGSWLAGFLADIFKDWRRDRALEDKGAADQRNKDFEEGERRRKDADQIRRETEGDGVIVGDDEL